jgi:hypothetical protein
MKKNKSLLHETIADISYIAGTHGYYSGNSRTDMQDFILLAKQFEKFHADNETDWNDLKPGDLDYMEAIEKFTKENLRLRKKLDFTPEAADLAWDNIEIEPINEDERHGCSRTDDENPDFYSVYLHQVRGGVQCVADVPTEEHANALRDLIAKAVRNFKDNGYMKLYDNKNLQEEFNKILDKVIAKIDTNNVNHFRVTTLKKQFNDLFI